MGGVHRLATAAESELAADPVGDRPGLAARQGLAADLGHRGEGRGGLAQGPGPLGRRTSPAASAVVSTARTNGHRVRSAAARDTSPVSVFPMMTPARSRASPCPPGKPASASARPAVSSASQWAGSVAR